MTSMPSDEALLAAVERLPGASLEVDDARESARVRVGPRLIADVDLRHGRVVVDAPADVVPTLQRVFACAHPTANGVVFDLADGRSRSEALAAIDRRVNVERLLGQYRTASP